MKTPGSKKRKRQGRDHTYRSKSQKKKKVAVASSGKTVVPPIEAREKHYHYLSAIRLGPRLRARAPSRPARCIAPAATAPMS